MKLKNDISETKDNYEKFLETETRKIMENEMGFELPYNKAELRAKTNPEAKELKRSLNHHKRLLISLEYYKDKTKHKLEKIKSDRIIQMHQEKMIRLGK